MAIIKCKMCGGDMEISADKTFGTCEYCGCTMTLPKIDDEQRASIFNRGNHFRRSGEFDKALAVYERIVAEDDADAEAHWCCALCRFGIEYVEDPATYEWLPTCHRASFDSFLEDVDYLAALEHSNGITRRQYQKDAAKIAEVQRGILATSQNTEPYDVFISYKELDENGDRTRDSLLAQEIYYQLTEQGRRVFFSRISLEDVPGTQYEPYIFAALNSARVMVVVGTSAENLNAVWVKNEWSRFLSMMRKDRSKLLIPCYRDMDPYDLPEQLSVLMSYDMGKIGFIQDLVRGIDKVMGKKQESAPVPAPVVQQVVQSTGGVNTDALMKRGFMALEDGEWDRADRFFEDVLNENAECAEAYLGKLMAELNVRRQTDLKDCAKPFDDRSNYLKAVRFGDTSLKAELEADNQYIRERNELARLTGIYDKAVSTMENAKTKEAYMSAAEGFKSISGYKDADALAEECLEKVENARKYAIYNSARSNMAEENIAAYETAINAFRTIPGWRDSDEQLQVCEKKIEEIKAKEEADRLEAERVAEQNRIEAARLAAEKKRKAKKAAIIAAAVAVLVAIAVIVVSFIGKVNAYKSAEALLESGDKVHAAMTFSKLGGYSDARERSFAIWDETAVRDTVSAGGVHTVGLKANGTVVAVGDNDDGRCNVSGWTDIVALSAGNGYTAGLKADGTVVAVGCNDNGQCDVSGWTDIVAISVGDSHTVGLKSDGTTIAVGVNTNGRCNVSDWTDIVAISAGSGHTVGLKSDGTVVAVQYSDKCDVSGWTDIVAISAGRFHTVGLKADGTVVAVGNNNYNQCDVSGWTDIVAISTGWYHTIGLKSDGTVVAVGNNNYNQCDVSDWRDIVAIIAGGHHTAGLKSDGTVVAVGNNSGGRCDVSGWTDIKLPAKRDD